MGATFFRKACMTENTTPQPAAAASTLCESCAGVQQNWRRAKGHPELVQGTNRMVAHRHGSVTITKYVCERCGTVWEYENNKVNRHAGWSVIG
jgi:hypothetical protein